MRLKHWNGEYVKLGLTKQIARMCSHQGQCDDDVQCAIRYHKFLREQRDKMDKIDLQLELRRYGAWALIDLMDHDVNFERLLWIASGDIVEGIQ